MTTIYAPYLLPSEESFELAPWQRVLAAEPEPLPKMIAGWAPGTPINLTRSLTVERSEFLRTAGLSDDVDLWINVSWIGSNSKIRERVRRQVLTDGINVIDVSLPEERIGGMVTVRTTICLSHDLKSAPGIASRTGSILASDEETIVLEGDSSTFPTAVVDFASIARHPKASWNLVVSDDVEASFGGCFLLEINEQDKRLVAAIEAEKPKGEQKVLLDSMMSGVGEVLLELALRLRKNGRLTDGTYEEGSVGAVLNGLLERADFETTPDLDDPVGAAGLRSALQGAAQGIGFGLEF